MTASVRSIPWFEEMMGADDLSKEIPGEDAVTGSSAGGETDRVVGRTGKRRRRSAPWPMASSRPPS